MIGPDRSLGIAILNLTRTRRYSCICLMQGPEGFRVVRPPSPRVLPIPSANPPQGASVSHTTAMDQTRPRPPTLAPDGHGALPGGHNVPGGGQIVAAVPSQPGIGRRNLHCVRTWPSRTSVQAPRCGGFPACVRRFAWRSVCRFWALPSQMFGVLQRSLAVYIYCDNVVCLRTHLRM